MDIITDISLIKPIERIVTVGMFDGVHCGHQSLLYQLCEKAKQLQIISSVLTFWPHPRTILSTENIELLNLLDEKIEIFKTTSIDELIIIPFTKEFSQHTPEEFINEYLVQRLHARYFLMGYNHHFGKGTHTLEDYEKMTQAAGLQSSRVERFEINNLKCSSSEIRKYIKNGDIPTANKLLGYEYSLRGTITQGDQIGRKIGFPTANMKINDKDKLIPPDGVYACIAIIDNKKYEAVVNIGYRPTFNGTEHRIEAHILNYKNDIYGNKMELKFVKKIRNESKFNNENSLKQMIFNDIATTKQIFEEKQKLKNWK